MKEFGEEKGRLEITTRMRAGMGVGWGGGPKLQLPACPGIRKLRPPPGALWRMSQGL